MNDETVKPARSPRIKAGVVLPADVMQKVDEYVDTCVPDKHKIATGRALRAQVPISTAVKIKCLSCCNYDRDEVANCTVVTCALHPVRPYQSKTTDN